MIAVITLIELKSPLKFFGLAKNALNIMQQMKSLNYKAFKKTGFWTTHYTMSLWENKADMQAFARSGAHLESMKKSAELAHKIMTLTIETEALPDWSTAKTRLKNEGKVLNF
jgi:hypothetical protein